MKKLLEILSDLRPDLDFSTEIHLIGDGILDSFDILSLVEEINGQFEVEIKQQYLIAENFDSVEAIWNLINMLQENN